MADKLQFNIEVGILNTGGPEAAKINAAIQQIGSTVGLTNAQFTAWSSVLTSTYQKTKDLTASLNAANSAGLAMSKINPATGIATAAPEMQMFIRLLNQFTVAQRAAVNAAKESARSGVAGGSGPTEAQLLLKQLTSNGGRGGGGGLAPGSGGDWMSQLLSRLGGRVIGGEVLTRGLGIPGGGYAGAGLLAGLKLSPGAVGGVIAGAGIGLAGIELLKNIEETTKYAQAQQNLAMEVGITSREMDTLSRIAQVTGVHLKGTTVETSKLGEEFLKGGTRAREIDLALDKLGLGKDVLFKETSDAMGEIAAALAKIEDPARRSAVAVQLLKNSGRELAAIAPEFASLSKSLTVEDKAIDSLAKYYENWQKLKQIASETWLNNLYRVLSLKFDFTGIGAATDEIAAAKRRQEEAPRKQQEALDKSIRAEDMRRVRTKTGTSSDVHQATIEDIKTREEELKDNYLQQRITYKYNPDGSVQSTLPPRNAAEYESRYRSLEQEKASADDRKAADDRLRSLRRQADEKEAEAVKKGQEEFSKQTFGTSTPGGRYQDKLYKIQLEQEDSVRIYSPAIGEDAARRRAERIYGMQRSAAGQEFLNEEMKGKARIGPDGKVEFPEQIAAHEGALDFRLTKEEGADQIRSGRLGQRESPQNAFYDPSMGKAQQLQDVPLPPGWTSIKEEEKKVKEFQRQGLESIRTQRTLGQVGGFQAAEADYNLRIQVADKERNVAELKAKFAEDELNSTKAKQLRADADEEQLAQYAQARLDKEREIANVTANQMREFSGGFASIIMGAQHGKAGPAIKGFLEGQESRLLENVGGMVFRSGVGKALQGFGKFLPAEVTKGTLLESPTDRPEEKIKTGGESIKSGALKFENTAARLEQFIANSTFLPGVGTSPSGGFAAIPGINPPGMDGGGSSIPRFDELGRWVIDGSVVGNTTDQQRYDQFGRDITPLPTGGNTLPGNFPGVFGAGGTLASLAPFLDIGGMPTGNMSGGPSGYGAYGTLDSSGNSPGKGTSSFMSNIQGVTRGAGFMVNSFGGKGLPGAFSTIFGGSNPNAFTDETGQSPSDWGIGNGPSGSASATERLGAAIGVAAAGAGAFAGITKIAQGGAKNVTGGLATTLAAVGPLTGPAAPFVEGAAAVMGIVSSILGDPKKQRADEISKQIFTSRFIQPEAQNITEAGGGYSDTDMYGIVRTSKFSPYNTTSSSFLDVPRRTVVPGREISTFGGLTDAPSAMNLPNPYFRAQPPPNYNVTINAFDPSSFADVMNKNAPAVLDAIHTSLQTGYHPVIGTLKAQVGGNG